MYGAARGRQRGVAVLVVVALLLLGGLMFALGTVKVTAVSVERERSSNDALAQAKDGLIAAAVSDNVRPGQLPCPDINDDGEATSPADFNAATGACVSLIGRLPWKTLGLPDLRDDSGERLWYAVSNDFRASNTAVPLNSDTAFRALVNQSLTLNGFTPASNLAAIVIAPGAVLRRSDGHSQVRGCGAVCNANDFLDIAAAEDNADGNGIFVSAQRSDTFNDRLMPVYSDDIMRLVERRAARELAQHLRDHYNAWNALAGAPGYTGFKGFYPYAVNWSDPSAPPQAGNNGTTLGLLPLSTAPLTWSNFPPLAGGNGCWTENGGTLLRCRTSVVCVIICVLTVPISGRVDDVATRFVDPPAPPTVRLDGLVIGSGGANWTLNAAARRLQFNYSFPLIAAGTLELDVAAPPSSAWLATSWLTQNNWQQDAGYVFAAGYAIDGANACGGVAPSCLTVVNTAAPNNNKRAVVAMSGRSLAAAGQTARPVTVPANINEFFEGLNADFNFTQFEANARTATFNDTLMFVDTTGAVGP